jgi:KaiC/GvpD/RAD55 family RecA-like ATPase
MSNLERKSIGVAGLDEMLGGGFPNRSIILVCGGPGVGKTILSLQYMVEAINRGEPCVYVSLEEPMAKKTQNARAFGWDLLKLAQNNQMYVLDLFMVPQNKGDVEAVDRKRGKIQYSIEEEIISAANQINAKHVIIDPLTSILIHESRSDKKRSLIGQLYDSIRRLECSALITSEGTLRENEFYMEQFLSDGVILLNKDIQEFKLIKTLRIDKMRGIDFDDQPRRFTITSRGFQVFNTEPVMV